MRGPLLVTDEDVPDRISEHRVVRGQDCTAWIAEHVGDAFPNQRFPEDLRTLETHNVSLRFHPVTAPVAAEDTSRAYFASTPDV